MPPRDLLSRFLPHPFFQMDPFFFRVPHTVMNAFKEVIHRAAEDHVKRQNVQFRVGVQGLLCIILPGVSYHLNLGCN